MANKTNPFTLGALMLTAGGVVGAGLALLFAPQSGTKTRRQIVRYGKKARNEVEKMYRDAAHSVTSMVDDLSETTTNLMEQSTEVADEWRKHLLGAIEQGEKDLEKQRKKLASLLH